MQFFAAVPAARHQVRALEDRQVLRHCLACHVEPVAQFAQRLPAPSMQPVQQLAAACIGERAKDGVIVHADIMQPFGCMSRANRVGLPAAAGLLGLCYSGAILANMRQPEHR